MSLWERAGLAALRCAAPETAHGLALKALNAGLVPLPGPITSPRLETEIAGLALPNPLGLAAGFDKNGQAIGPLGRAGFGFLELGATTPKPQPGNPKPRLFRLTEDAAAINRFGFNNTGMEAMAKRLAARPKTSVVGLNLGANKDSSDRAADFAKVLAACGADLDFATVNVSSPNTERLRDLQGKAALAALLQGVFKSRDALPTPIPVFLKIAPDLDADALKDIASLAQEMPLAGIITTNTTLDRTGLKSSHKGEKGGLSGAPLFEKSSRITAQLYALTEGQVPLIGVGGIASAEDAWTKLRAGASALQLYTALSYQGLGLVPRILNGLDETLQSQGYTNLAQAVGTDHESWL